MTRKAKSVTAVMLSFIMAVSPVGTSLINSAAAERADGFRGTAGQADILHRVRVDLRGLRKTPKSATPIKGPVWDGTADVSWFTGDKDSYDISTAEQLAGLAQIANTVGDEYRFQGITINLTSDIVLNDTSGWQNWKTNPPENTWIPIGQIGSPVKGYRPFAGCFNGNGHTITGMYVNQNSECGLFTYTSSAVIKDLKITNSVVIGTNGATSSGSLAGVAESTYFDNCSCESVIVSGTREVGGLVGSARRINAVVPFMQFALLGFGVAVNPLIFKAVESGNASGTYFSGCSVLNADLSTACDWYSAPVGGIVGEYFMDGIISNCSSSSVSVSSIDTVTVKYPTPHTGPCGAICGKTEDCTVVIDQCVSCGFKRTDAGTERSDADTVPEVE